MEPLSVKDGHLLLRYKNTNSPKSIHFTGKLFLYSNTDVLCSDYEVNVTDSQMAGLKHPTCTLRIRADPVEAL